jgi:uroporphyrinogen-III synthase
VSAARPLAGLGVVITRPHGPAEAAARVLERAGARAFVFPSLRIEEIASTPELEAAIDSLGAAAIAVFVSANAVEKGLAAVRARREWPAGVEVAAVGEATAQALRNSGFANVISPQGRHDSEALLREPRLRAVRGENIIVFRGEGGREHLRQELEARGARVAYAQCYRRSRPHSDPSALLQAWDRGEIHAVSALSAETLENFVALLGAGAERRLANVALVVPHEAIAAHPDARRFRRAIVSPQGAEGLAQALEQIRVPT